MTDEVTNETIRLKAIESYIAWLRGIYAMMSVQYYKNKNFKFVIINKIDNIISIELTTLTL